MRAKKVQDEAQRDVERELARRKGGKEAIEAKKKWEDNQAKREDEKLKREKEEEKRAKERIKQKIEQVCFLLLLLFLFLFCFCFCLNNTFTLK